MIAVIPVVEYTDNTKEFRLDYDKIMMRKVVVMGHVFNIKPDVGQNTEALTCGFERGCIQYTV